VSFFPLARLLLSTRVPDGDDELLRAIQAWAAGEGLEIVSTEFGMWGHGLERWSPMSRPRAYRVSLQSADGSTRLADIRRANFLFDRYVSDGETLGLRYHWFE
jgi:hypothetical protein